jgi:hypothetical protein
MGWDGDRQGTTGLKWWLGVIAVVVLLVWVFTPTVQRGPPDPPRVGLPPDPPRAVLDPCYAAQAAIEGRLHDPDSARFPSCLRAPPKITPEQGGSRVVSYVEIPDRGGIYRRRPYVIVIEPVGSRGWRIRELKF